MFTHCNMGWDNSQCQDGSDMKVPIIYLDISRSIHININGVTSTCIGQGIYESVVEKYRYVSTVMVFW